MERRNAKRVFYSVGSSSNVLRGATKQKLIVTEQNTSTSKLEATFHYT